MSKTSQDSTNRNSSDDFIVLANKILKVYFNKKVPLIFKYFHRKSKSTKRTRNDIKAPTMFENTNIKSIHLHIPVYDNNAFPKYRGIGTFKAISDKNYRKIYEKGW